MISECGNRLKLTSMGGGMVLIQSGSDKNTSEVLEGFDEWSRSWLKRWKPWEGPDVNRSRKVWTRWVGVPLQAWNPRFFSLVSWQTRQNT